MKNKRKRKKKSPTAALHLGLSGPFCNSPIRPSYWPLERLARRVGGRVLWNSVERQMRPPSVVTHVAQHGLA